MVHLIKEEYTFHLEHLGMISASFVVYEPDRKSANAQDVLAMRIGDNSQISTPQALIS